MPWPVLHPEIGGQASGLALGFPLDEVPLPFGCRGISPCFRSDVW